MMKPEVGVYIHIPFCRRKCLYCDFCSFTETDDETRARYVDAVVRELSSYRAALASYRVDTVYVGGGTPSLLTERETARILGTLHECFDVCTDAEITSEANPATADEDKLRAWYRMGIRRLSVGVQSFSDEELQALGRLHTADEAEAFFSVARRAGYENISMDLMYGIPRQSRASLTATLRRAIRLAPTHISAYSLQVEEGTPFYLQREGLLLPDDDENAALYQMTAETLEAAGYRQYEISNYARAGFTCRHNLRYWRMSPYIGVGVAAYSYFGGDRYGHARDLAAYLADDFSSRPSPEVRTEADTEEEYVMLGLRLSDGIEDDAYRCRFGVTFTERYGERLAPMQSAGLVRRTEGGWALTRAGMYVSLAILTELMA